MSPLIILNHIGSHRSVWNPNGLSFYWWNFNWKVTTHLTLYPWSPQGIIPHRMAWSGIVRRKSPQEPQAVRSLLYRNWTG